MSLPQNLTAQQIFDLLKAENLQAQTGRIEVFFAGITLLVKDKSSVGNLLYQIEKVRRTFRLKGVSKNTVFDRYGAIRVFCGLHSI